ncbi:MAG TPA: hypothetical protein VHF92_03790 [Geodermatophilus sp.]|nr:hypothetical protein [Geodermatophilus sp.]
MFYPRREVVEVSLRPLRLCGLDQSADELAQRLDMIAGRRMMRRQPHVPVQAVLEHWTEFFDEFLPDYVAAIASAEACGTGAESPTRSG